MNPPPEEAQPAAAAKTARPQACETNRTIELDDMLETPAAAKWLGLSVRELLTKSKGRKAKIPAMWLNRRVVRYHPRTIIAKLAVDAGVSPEVIAASLRMGAGTCPPQQGNHEPGLHRIALHRARLGNSIRAAAQQ